jgi:exodeoxyribonuclease-3
LRSGGREKGIGWRLDYFVVNEELFKNVASSEIMDQVHGSDHCPIHLDITFK